MNKNTIITMSALLLLQACSAFSSGSRADFAIPGCEKAWVAIDKAMGLDSLKLMVVNNCPELYEPGWRNKDRRFKREVVNPEQCKQAWSQFKKADQLENLKFMITHNCPVFYRHGWIIPPR